MAIVIKSGKDYYEVPADVLKKCKITKKQFDKACKAAGAEVAGQCDDCNLVDLRTCCMSKKSLWASCL